jgi:hypothetical protein
VVLPHYPATMCGESCLLVSWCVSGWCGMAGSVRIMVGVGDLVQRTVDDQS